MQQILISRNFSLHLVNLFEFGVVGPGHVFTAISRLQVSSKQSKLMMMFFIQL